MSGIADNCVEASDSLKGNGGCTGYTLTHAGPITNSETIRVNGFIKIRNRDYKLDYSTGAITFLEAVPSGQAIEISYRCTSDGKAVSSTSMGFTGGNMTGGLMYVVNPADTFGGANLVTYGLNLTTKLNSESSMTNMFFSSDSQAGLAGSKGSATGQQSDHMFVNETDLKVGGVDLKVDYQSVGRNFAFSGLKQQGAAPLDKLQQLEKEKGLQRMGFQAGTNFGMGLSTIMGFKEIKDDGGNITNEWLNFGDSHFKFEAGMQDVSKGFTRFSDIAETNRGQLAKEAGIRRQNLTLGFATAKGVSGDGWNALKFNNIIDPSGKVTLGSLNLAGRNFSFFGSQTKVDQSFTRLSSLSQDDINTMALDIRREFDFSAQAGNANAAESQNLLSVTGIERQNLLGSYSVGKTKIGMQFLTLGDSTGGVNREAFSAKGTNYSVSIFSQKIDNQFRRLSSLAPIEVQNFGNEYGMSRTNFQAAFIPKTGMQLNTYFNQVDAGNAGMQRYGLSWNAKTYSVAADYVNMDSNFTRAADLSDSDRAQLASEQGMSRYAITTHYQVGRFEVGNYLYDGKNSSAGTLKQQIRNNLAFNATKTMRFSLLRDDLTCGLQTDPSRSYHQVLGVTDRIAGASVSLNLDSVRSHTPGSLDQSTDTSTFHLDTDPSKRFILSTDIRRMGDNLGKFQNDQTFRLTSKISDRFSLLGLRTESQTDQSLSTNDEIGVVGRLSKAFSFTAKFGQSLQNSKVIANTNELSFSPTSAHDLWSLKNLNFTLRLADTRKPGEDQNLTVGGKVSCQLFKQNVGFEFNGCSTTNAVNPVASGFDISGDVDPKKALHYSLSYKTANTATLGMHDVIRHYAFDWQVNKNTKVAYNLSDNGHVLPGSICTPVTESFRMSTVMSKQLSFIGQYESKMNRNTGNKLETTNVGLSGKLDSTSNVDVTVGVDHKVEAGVSSSSVDLRLKYDYQLSKDNFLTASGALTNWSGQHTNDPAIDNMLFQFGYKTLFH